MYELIIVILIAYIIANYGKTSKKNNSSQKDVSEEKPSEEKAPKKPYRNDYYDDQETLREEYERARSEEAVDNYERRPSIFTYSEQKLVHSLKKGLPEYHIFGQVRMCDIIRAPKDYEGYNVNAHDMLRMTWSKHIDIVITDKKLQTVCAVELHDATHNASDRKASDEFKSASLSNAGVTLIRVPQQKYFDAKQVSGKIRDVLAKNQGVLKPEPVFLEL